MYCVILLAKGDGDLKKIVIGGQIDKAEIKELAEQYANGKFEITVKSDLDAAMSLKNGQVDYYLGACNTGGGGALAMAIALVGRDACETVSMPGRIMDEADIRKSVRNGKKAFGFTAQHKNVVVPILMDELSLI